MAEILLESGTNELELLEFTVGDQCFGVNVAKVVEIMKYQKVTKVPGSDPAFEGVFTPRETVISVINLHEVLQRPLPDNTEGILVICHFNKIDVAFHVTAVQGIQRISWEDIDKPPEISSTATSSLATGIVKIKDDIVLILDFEKIVSGLNASAVLDIDGIEATQDASAAEKHIIIAEDSAFLNTLIVKSLAAAGYTNVSHFENGKDAWDFISRQTDPERSITCIISDIEMPKMDGHNLCKRIKTDNRLNSIPVYLFSSLITEQMFEKGKSVGADAQFSKPQINELIEYLKGHI